MAVELVACEFGRVVAEMRSQGRCGGSFGDAGGCWACFAGRGGALGLSKRMRALDGVFGGMRDG